MVVCTFAGNRGCGRFDGVLPSLGESPSKAACVRVREVMPLTYGKIINWLEPAVRRIQSIRVGWLIPVAILFVAQLPAAVRKW